jgi:hypothetical protein
MAMAAPVRDAGGLLRERRVNRTAPIIAQTIAATAPITSAIQKAAPKASVATSWPNNNTNKTPASKMTINPL